MEEKNGVTLYHAMRNFFRKNSICAIHEPDNPHDHNAVGIILNRAAGSHECIGYLKRETAKLIAGILTEQGIQLRGYVIAVNTPDSNHTYTILLYINNL